jgi:uncharacterized damage-inducible protein DinB
VAGIIERETPMTVFTPERALRDIRKTPVILSAILQHMDPEQARLATDGPDGWSVSEIVGHLKDYEEIFLSRAHQMLREDRPAFISHNQDELVRLRGYAAADVHYLFRALLELRREFVDLLSGLSEEQWRRTGVHSSWGEMTMVELVMIATLHDVNHADQIIRTLGLSDTLV